MLFYASTATGYDQMYWAMLLNWYYIPTLSLPQIQFHTIHLNEIVTVI